MAHPVPTRSLIAALVLLVGGCGGTDEPLPGTAGATSPPQGTSLFGEPLFEQIDTTGVIAAADADLAAAPNDVDLIIAAGRERRNYWQYRQAMELYTRAIELAPDDWRAYRYRGHRYISLREFDAAIVDLEAARQRAPFNWDVAYHLALAHFLSGDFSAAADEYVRCLNLADDAMARAAQADDFRSCSQNADDPESMVAMAEWAVRALMRAGRDTEADALLATIPNDLAIGENLAYYHNLLLHKGLMSAEDLLAGGPDAPYRLETVGYGVVNQMLAAGDTEAALLILERLYDDPWWPGFGRIAAEVELFRLGWRPGA